MSGKESQDPKVKKLDIKDEPVRELTDAETENVAGGMRRGGGCGDTGTTMSTCTKINTDTSVPSTETC